MYLGTVIVTIITVCAVFIPSASGQPTVQHASISWRPDPSVRCDNKFADKSPTLQHSIDLVLLELQKHSSETEDLQREMRDIHLKSDENMVLLKQMSESLDLLVKKFIKNEGCDCVTGRQAGQDGPASDRDSYSQGHGRKGGRGEGEREGGRGGRKGAGQGRLPDDYDDLDGYQKIPNTIPGAHLDLTDVARNDERVLMDAKGTVNAGNIGSHKGEDPGGGVDDLTVSVGGDSSRQSQGGGNASVTSGNNSPAETTTLPPDPIYQLYNGSVPKDCEDVKNLGYSRNSTYFIKPTMASRSLPVLCEFIDQEAWTLIQRRLDGSVDFYRTWHEYKVGFGDVSGEFWLGNDVIHQLTNQDYYRLRIDMWDWPRVTAQGKELQGKYYFAESTYFFVGDETDRYELHVPNDYFAFTGFGGSGLRVHAGPFLTKDVQELPEGMRQNCAQKFHCGWWFTTCVRNANFNGRYYKGGYADVKKKRRARDDIYWPNIEQSLRKVVMKIGRVNESYALGSYH